MDISSEMYLLQVFFPHWLSFRFTHSAGDLAMVHVKLLDKEHKNSDSNIFI